MYLSAAARELVEHESDRLPDLSKVVVLVPHGHVAGPFLRALREAIDAPVFLPPRLLTLPALAAEMPGEDSTQSPAERVSAMHAMLRRFDWIAGEARWPTAFGLLDLLDEMDASLLAPPAEFADFEAQLRSLGRRIHAAPLTREAELVFQVWRAFHQGPAGPMRDYAARLGRWSASPETALYQLGLHDLSRLEARFLARCAATRPVRVLTVEATSPLRADGLRRVWPVGLEAAVLRERARECARALPVSPFSGKVVLHGADGLEAEAMCAAARIRAWLAEGRQRIGIVALDRLAARRLRAILERDRILIRDETGWTFSTAVVSHVLDRFFALIEDDFYFRDVLDLLKSPYVFASEPDAERHAQLPEFERALHRDNVVRGGDGFRRLAMERGLDTLAALLSRLNQAVEAMAAGRPRTLAEWLDALLAALSSLGVVPAWERDTAGSQLLGLLRRLGRDLGRDATRYEYRPWRDWLGMQLDRATFQESEIDSPIRLTHLHASRLRDFEAVVVLGADAARLPAPPPPGPFGDAIRRELGLPGLDQARESARAALVDVLCAVDQVLITWQRSRNGDHNAASPWLESLRVFHRLAYGSDLEAPGPVPTDGAEPAETGGPPMPPAPALDRPPARLSASAWQTLIDCPYRYFARHGLGLGEADEAAEETEKRHYGELLHRILARFHARRPRLSDAPRAELSAELAALSDAVFDEAGLGDYLLRAWRYRWQHHIDDYIEWALAREVDGYRWRQGEVPLDRPLVLDSGATITLHGRLDRLDDGPEGLAVIDYKARSLATLRAKMRVPGEDVQLAFYGLLSGASRAELLGLDDKRIDSVGLPDFDRAVADEAERLRRVFDTLDLGAGLPASGAASTCRWCEMRGLCRKGHWAGA